MPFDELHFQFEVTKRICDKDNGRLWGKSLYSPILVIDQISKEIVANEPDLEGRLTKKGNVYTGKFCKDCIVASTAGDFGGKSWVMVSYPYHPEDTFDIYDRYIHESFHRIQGELGFTCKAYANSHMDKMDARLYLNLEWSALLKAVEISGTARDSVVKDALLFRKY
jgi:hypothetical protein